MTWYIAGLLLGMAFGIGFMPSLMHCFKAKEPPHHCGNCKYYETELNRCRKHGVYFWRDYSMCCEYECEDKE